MAIFFVLIAGACVALSNLFMRKSIDSGGTTKGFLVFQMLIACACAVLLEPVRAGNYAWNFPVTILGIVAGLFLGGLLVSLGKALEKGPAGLTFSILSGATVMPAVFMAIFFGSSMGFPYTVWHAIGSIFLVIGFFWAARDVRGLQDPKGWVCFVFILFCFHVALLSLFQWRSLLLGKPCVEEITSLFHAEEIKSLWFLPMMFFCSGCIQLYLFLSTERRKLKRQEAVYGILGGVGNSLGTFFLICATQVATPLENAIIFPMYSLAIIIISNLWSQKLYNEKINWRAYQICGAGLLIAMVDWKGLAAAIGF